MNTHTPKAKGSLDEAILCKEAGNENFKKEKYHEAIKCYTDALSLSPQDHECRAVFLKNRAACYLKLKQYSLALDDCTKALDVVPNDEKALYRRAIAKKESGNFTDAFTDIKLVLSINPHNREAIELAQNLTVAIKKQQDTLQSTEGIIKEMLEALSDPNLPQDKLTMVVKNCAILSKEVSAAKHLYQAGAIDMLLPYLNSNSEIASHVLQTFAGMCIGHKSHANSILDKITPVKFSLLIGHKSDAVACSAVAVIKQVLSEIVGDHTSDTTPIMPLVDVVFALLLNQSLSTSARDRVMEMLISTIPKSSLMVSVYLKSGLTSTLLRFSALSECTEENLNISEDARANTSVVLSTFYRNCKEEEKKTMEEECKAFVATRLLKPDLSAKREAIVAVATLLHGVLDVGAKIFGEKSVFDEILLMASSDNVTSQSIAAEALALAASNKQRCQEIIKEGLPVLKKLCLSAEDSVKVRALVGLCKLGGMGGSNVNARTFAEGSGLKLERACTKFLLSAPKRGRLYKWAVEGLAFLSLDAEVKEALVSKERVLKILCSVPKSGEKSLLYGLATIFVNVTNSYDKPERNPELEELGKYAGENVPREHELDGDHHIKKRVSCLLKVGIVPALLDLAAVESDAIHEQVSRVFLALVEQNTNRGLVIQQGGVRLLLPLTSSNTVKGKLIAAQALAKIAITSDPKLSFPGQRSLEVVRPLVQLLKSEQGLQQFESLMALTNLASTSDDVRHRIIKEGGIPLAESLMFEEHELIRRASTEFLCNMVQMPQVHERFLNDDIERVKLWTLFSGEDDFELARAAAGGLAQLTHDPRICTKVMEVKSATAILKELLASEKGELQHRAAYIVANLMAANKDIASGIVASDFLEILMALLQVPAVAEPVKSSANRALQKAVDYGLIQHNPELNNA